MTEIPPWRSLDDYLASERDHSLYGCTYVEIDAEGRLVHVPYERMTAEPQDPQ